MGCVRFPTVASILSPLEPQSVQWAKAHVRATISYTKNGGKAGGNAKWGDSSGEKPYIGKINSHLRYPTNYYDYLLVRRSGPAGTVGTSEVGEDAEQRR